MAWLMVYGGETIPGFVWLVNNTLRILKAYYVQSRRDQV